MFTEFLFNLYILLSTCNPLTNIHINFHLDCCSLLLSLSGMSNSLWLHGLQHARFPCPSPFPRACSNSCPLSRWCHPTISSSAIPFSSCLQSFPASGSFPVSHQKLAERELLACLTGGASGEVWSSPQARVLSCFLSASPVCRPHRRTDVHLPSPRLEVWMEETQWGSQRGSGTWDLGPRDRGQMLGSQIITV